MEDEEFERIREIIRQEVREAIVDIIKACMQIAEEAKKEKED